jgi:hypothetical protein
MQKQEDLTKECWRRLTERLQHLGYECSLATLFALTSSEKQTNGSAMSLAVLLVVPSSKKTKQIFYPGLFAIESLGLSMELMIGLPSELVKSFSAKRASGASFHA